jgi:hypothetical protein
MTEKLERKLFNRREVLSGLIGGLAIGNYGQNLVYGGDDLDYCKEKVSFENFRNYFGNKRLDSLLETKKIDEAEIRESWEKLPEDEKKSLQLLYSHPKKFLEKLKKERPKVFKEFEKSEKIYQREMGDSPDEEILKLLNIAINSKKSKRSIPYDLDMANISDRIYLSIENSRKKK